MRYYNKDWVPQTDTGGRSGNVFLAILCTLVLAAIAVVVVWAFPAFSARGLDETTVFIQAELPDGTVSQGSGSVISPRGYIITNRHVVFTEDGRKAEKITVWLRSGTSQRREFPTAQLKASSEEPPNKGDISTLWRDWAVLKIDQEPTHPYPYIRIGDPLRLKQGDPVSAAGFPLGSKAAPGKYGPVFSLDRGVLKRPLSGDTESAVVLVVSTKFDPGISGGPVCNSHGELVGIATPVPALFNPQALAVLETGENCAIPAHLLNEKVWTLYAGPAH